MIDETLAVCVPTIPPRGELLRRALDSVTAQTLQPTVVTVVTDADGVGAAQTRNLAWRDAATDWVAFLDDDDELYPQHLETLWNARGGVDLVYPWFDLPNGVDPLAVRVAGQLVSPFGLAFGDDHRVHILNEGNFIPVTVLVRRALLDAVDGFPQPRSARWAHDQCEDWGCWQDLLRVGAQFKHVPERTWLWRWHGGNTSGKPWRQP